MAVGFWLSQYSLHLVNIIKQDIMHSLLYYAFFALLLMKVNTTQLKI